MFIRYICKDSRHGSQQICVVHFGAEPSHQTHLPLATCHSEFTLDHFLSNMSSMYPTQYEILSTDSNALMVDQT
jgi:hypothetical protein